MSGLQKNVSGQNCTFCMVSASTGAADASATVSVHVTKDNGTQASGGGTVTNSGNGQYNYAPTQAETDATDVGFLFTATGDIPVNYDFHTDVVDANGYPSTNLVDIAGSAVSTSAAQLGVNAVNIAGQAAALDANNFLKVDVADILGTASVGAAGYVGIDWSAIDNPTHTQNLGSTTISTGQTITSAGSVTGSVGSVTGNVGGSVTGSVGSVVGSVASVTGNVGGSVTGSVGSVIAGVNATEIGGSTVAATQIGLSGQKIGNGTVGTGSTTTSIVTSALNPSNVAAGQFQGRIMIFDNATTTTSLRGQATAISTDNGSGTFTVAALTTSPVSGDTFTIT